MSKRQFIAGLLCSVVWVLLLNQSHAQVADPFAPDPFGDAPAAKAQADRARRENAERKAAELRARADALEEAAEQKVERARQVANEARERNNAKLSNSEPRDNELKKADAVKPVTKKPPKKNSIATFFGELITKPTEQVMRTIQGRPAKPFRPPVAEAARFAAPPVAVAVPARPVAEQLDPQAAQRKQQIERYTQNYIRNARPLLLSELQVIRQTCDLPVEKRPPIKAAGETAIKQWATAMAEMVVGARGRVVGGNIQQDPRKGLREALTQAVKKEATAEQFAKYTELVNYQAAMRKQAAISAVVSLMDDELFLTPKQRKKITGSITQAWQDDWENWLQIHQYGGRYVPSMPADKVLPHLNAKQKQIWKSMRKINLQNNWNFHHHAQVQADNWWGAEAAAQPPQNIFIMGNGPFLD